jgi:hypothetical protein
VKDLPAPLALIIDDDLGFVMWLGEVCHELGWQSVPALHCRKALAWMERFDLPVTAAMVNPELSGAASAVKQIAVCNPGARIVLICSRPGSMAPGPTRRARRSIVAHAVLRRPSPGEAVFHADWAQEVRKLLPIPKPAPAREVRFQTLGTGTLNDS